MKKIKNKAKIFKLLQTLVSVLPLLALIIVNWNVYTKTTASTVSLGFGMLLAIIFAILKILDRLPKNVKGVFKAGIVCALCWALKSLVVDLPIIATAWFIGECLAECFTPIIKKATKQEEVSEQANATAEEVAKQIQNIIGNGRV